MWPQLKTFCLLGQSTWHAWTLSLGTRILEMGEPHCFLTTARQHHDVWQDANVAHYRFEHYWEHRQFVCQLWIQGARYVIARCCPRKNSWRTCKIDTARKYCDGTTEEVLADIRAPDIFQIATKVAPTEPGNHRREKLKAIFHESLQALKIDKVDILYLHAPVSSNVRYERDGKKSTAGIRCRTIVRQSKTLYGEYKTFTSKGFLSVWVKEKVGW